jgi:hypothetical protein
MLKNTHPISSEYIDDNFNGYMVHVSGEAEYNWVPIEPLSIEIKAASVRLNSRYFIWTEHCTTRTETRGDDEYEVTECEWTTGWSSVWLPGDFLHMNPYTQLAATSFASEFSVGAFAVDSGITRQATCDSVVFDERGGGTFEKIAEGEYYRGLGSRWWPVVGDVWVDVSVFNPSDASVIGQRDGRVIRRGQLNGTATGLVAKGRVGADAMVTSWVSALKAWRWVAVGQAAFVAVVTACVGLRIPAAVAAGLQLAALALHVFLRGNQEWGVLAGCAGASLGAILVAWRRAKED